MLLSLILRGITGPTAFDNGVPIPLDPQTRKLMEGISPLIKSQVPDFVNADHENFVAFLESYYEFMEQEGNATERTLLLNDYRDIERTLDQFINSFDETFIKNAPKNIEKDTSGNLLDRKTILTEIKDFYAIKGTQKSFEFFFRAFYSSICEFYYPRTDIIEVSGGNWIEKKSIRVSSSNGTNNFNMLGKIVSQKDSNGLDIATARVEEVFQYDIYPYKVTELFLSDIQGTFSTEYRISVDVDESTTLTESVFGIIGSFSFSNEGRNYTFGDRIVLRNPGAGVGLTAKVSRVDNIGSIKQVSIIDPGANYETQSSFVVESETGDGSATGEASTSALVNYDGFFFDDGGKTSSRKKLQDNHYYQRFSYVLKTNLSLERYKTALLALVHPAGFKVFGNVLLTNNLKSNLPFHSRHQTEELSIIGNYTPYTFGTTQDLRSNNSTSGTSVDLYPSGYAPGFTGVTANGNTFALVPEGGVTAHVVGIGATGALGSTAEAGGFTAAQSLNLNFFPIFHHPNVRGLNDIPSGLSFAAVGMRPFFAIPVGNNFHSYPTYSTWTSPQFPYLGSTAGGGAHDEYYSVPYGTTSETPND